MKRAIPQSLGDVIQRMIDDTGMREGYEKHNVESLWPTVVGPAIARYTRQVWLDPSNVLHVQIQSASLTEELSYMRDSLVQHINDAYGAPKVVAVVFH